MNLATILLAATLGSSQPAIPNDVPFTEELPQRVQTEESLPTNVYGNFVGIDVLGAYALDKIGLKKWEFSDFKNYLEDSWPAGFGTKLSWQASINDVCITGSIAGFSTQGIFSDLLKLSGGFTEERNGGHEIINDFFGDNYTISIDGKIRINGRWATESNANIYSFGTILPVMVNDNLFVDRTTLDGVIRIDYFKYDVKGSSKSKVSGSGTITLYRNKEDLWSYDLDKTRSTEFVTDIAGRGGTLLLGPRIGFTSGRLTVYAATLAEFIIEDQQYKFTVMGDRIELPNNIEFSKRNDNISLGYDFSLLFDIYDGVELRLGINGDSGLTDVAEIGLRRNF